MLNIEKIPFSDRILETYTLDFSSGPIVDMLRKISV